VAKCHQLMEAADRLLPERFERRPAHCERMAERADSCRGRTQSAPLPGRAAVGQFPGMAPAWSQLARRTQEICEEIRGLWHPL
jgi:hypothetical protein